MADKPKNMTAISHYIQSLSNMELMSVVDNCIAKAITKDTNIEKLYIKHKTYTEQCTFTDFRLSVLAELQQRYTVMATILRLQHSKGTRIAVDWIEDFIKQHQLKKIKYVTQNHHIVNAVELPYGMLVYLPKQQKYTLHSFECEMPINNKGVLEYLTGTPIEQLYHYFKNIRHEN